VEEILNFKNRNIAITDLETTGLDPLKHEIIEIGLVLVKQPELEIIDTLGVKVKPTNRSNADPKALELNGYSEHEWHNALSLTEALTLYFGKAKGSIFCAHNVTFDLPFIKSACLKTGITNTLDYHNIDILALAWSKFRKSKLERVNLRKLAAFMGLKPEPQVHRALNGAELEYRILKRLTVSNFQDSDR